jgi:hypothetical protein
MTEANIEAVDSAQRLLLVCQLPSVQWNPSSETLVPDSRTHEILVRIEPASSRSSSPMNGSEIATAETSCTELGSLPQCTNSVILHCAVILSCWMSDLYILQAALPC